jgi:sugar phosphate isomerase/epimerase
MNNKILWSGQNGRWGELEEATRAWTDMGMKSIMIRQIPSSMLLSNTGELVEPTFQELSKLQKEFGVKYHFHPFDLEVKGKFLTLSTPEERKVMKYFLTELDQRIEKYSFYPLINLHLPFFVRPKQDIKIGEKEALSQAIDFYQDLDLKANVAIETMHDPFMNGESGTAILGYKASQFREIIGKKNIGLCIDTGHINLSAEPTRIYLALPYPIHSIHLHGNNLHNDQHQLPIYLNVMDYNATIDAIKKCTGPVVLEIGSDASSRKGILDCIDYWQDLVD